MKIIKIVSRECQITPILVGFVSVLVVFEAETGFSVLFLYKVVYDQIESAYLELKNFLKLIFYCYYSDRPRNIFETSSIYLHGKNTSKSFEMIIFTTVMRSRKNHARALLRFIARSALDIHSC